MNRFAKTFTLSACALGATVLISACGGGSDGPVPATDTMPPVVLITDNVSAATATGPVTFTFTFSEDIGTSFTVEDVVVTGGTVGAFELISGTVATLVVTPVADAAGTIAVSVAAAKYEDLASNKNSAASSATQDYNTLTTEPPPVATNLVTNGDFSSGATGWSGNALNVLTEGGNSFNYANVAVAGNAFDVNLSYVLDIPTSGVGYKLRFKASSDRTRTMIAGIGLNQAPFDSATQQVNLTTTLQTFELSLTSNFASATSRVIFDMGADTGVVVIDDVELVLDTATAPAGGPTVAASVPTALEANVKSIFSDSYTNVTVDAWGPDWGPASARITDGVVAGNNYKTIDMSTAGQEFAGISFVSSKFDATAYTTFNMDYWVDTPLPAGQVINIKLSNHDGSGETSAIQYLVNPVTGGGWQRLSIPLSSFTVAGGGSASRNNIAEIIITAARADTSQPVKVYFDNMYFSK